MPCVSILHKSVHVQLPANFAKNKSRIVKLYTFREFTVIVGKFMLLNIIFFLISIFKKGLTHKDVYTLLALI